MRVLSMLWRWFTLADAPTIPAELRIDPVHGCQFCGNPRAGQITVNSKTWRACLEHFDSILAELGDARPDGR